MLHLKGKKTSVFSKWQNKKIKINISNMEQTNSLRGSTYNTLNLVRLVRTIIAMCYLVSVLVTVAMTRCTSGA